MEIGVEFLTSVHDIPCEIEKRPKTKDIKVYVVFSHNQNRGGHILENSLGGLKRLGDICIIVTSI